MMRYLEFDKKTALVTGGNSGIGKATALAFAQNGANVAITGRDEVRGLETKKELEALGVRCEFYLCDVKDAAAVKKTIEQVVTDFGSLDYCFNNAGVAGERGYVHQCSLENWHEVLDTCLNGVFYCLKYEIEVMLKQGKGAIVNNSSVSGLKSYPGLPAYITAKHGVIAITKASASETAPYGIRINGVCPGLIYAGEIKKSVDQNDPKYMEWAKNVQPIGRIGDPSEVAATVLWLCSEQASLITGQSVAVDGGLTVR